MLANESLFKASNQASPSLQASYRFDSQKLTKWRQILLWVSLSTNSTSDVWSRTCRLWKCSVSLTIIQSMTKLVHSVELNSWCNVNHWSRPIDSITSDNQYCQITFFTDSLRSVPLLGGFLESSLTLSTQYMSTLYSVTPFLYYREFKSISYLQLTWDVPSYKCVPSTRSGLKKLTVGFLQVRRASSCPNNSVGALKNWRMTQLQSHCQILPASLHSKPVPYPICLTASMMARTNSGQLHCVHSSSSISISLSTNSAAFLSNESETEHVHCQHQYHHHHHHHHSYPRYHHRRHQHPWHQYPIRNTGLQVSTREYWIQRITFDAEINAACSR